MGFREFLSFLITIVLVLSSSFTGSLADDTETKGGKECTTPSGIPLTIPNGFENILWPEMMRKTCGKVVVLLLTVIAAMCFASCSKLKPEPTYQREPATYQRKITGQDVFEKGYYYQSLGSHSKVTVRKLDPDSHVTWKVYFTKDKLPEDEVEKLLERTPDITNAGEFNASQYDYVYFFCDVNSKNYPEPTDDMIMLNYMATYA